MSYKCPRTLPLIAKPTQLLAYFTVRRKSLHRFRPSLYQVCSHSNLAAPVWDLEASEVLVGIDTKNMLSLCDNQGPPILLTHDIRWAILDIVAATALARPFLLDSSRCNLVLSSLFEYIYFSRFPTLLACTLKPQSKQALISFSSILIFRSGSFGLGFVWESH